MNGTVISAGPDGVIDGANVSTNAYANTILNSIVAGDAYYQTISGTTVSGTEYPGSDDQATTSLPISDFTIESWEDEAALGTIYDDPCPFEISSDITIGPAKIECDLEISGSPTITLTGAVWVEGNMTIINNPIIKIAPSLGPNSTGFIVDNRSNRSTSSTLILQNNAVFENSGTEGAYVFLISQNDSVENGGSTSAITVKNNAEGDVLLYAGHGEILIENNGDQIRQATAYKIRLQNNAIIVYQTGLPSILFQAGPGGSWSITDWREVE